MFQNASKYGPHYQGCFVLRCINLNDHYKETQKIYPASTLQREKIEDV